MRIIGGKHRGKKLAAPEGANVRPTSDKVRECVFDVIQFRTAGARFLDLFCGSGAMGAEALSRGAREVVFADADGASLKLTERNLIGIDGDRRLLRGDYRMTLERVQGPFDFIFVDPPYDKRPLGDILEIVSRRGLLAAGGQIIYEHRADTSAALPLEFRAVKRKRFGIVAVDFIEPSGVCAVTGSFDPVTAGHWGVVAAAAAHYGRVRVVIAVNPDKKSLFSLEERKRILEACIGDDPNIDTDICAGYVHEYCTAHGIPVIVRGYRDADDLRYEREMAAYNKAHGGVETQLVAAEPALRNVRSTAVRERLTAGQPLRGLVPRAAEATIKKIYRQKYGEEYGQ